MPIIAGVIGAVGAVAGAVTGAVGGVMAANAQQGIANAQRAQAESDRAAVVQAAAPTAQELSTISDRINQQARYQSIQEAGLARDTTILNSLDPALVQAGQQAQSLMSGQQAAILAPMRQQQQFERNQLQQKLAAQLGPGFETSSAGQAALQQFDMQSNLQTQQAQMSAFNNVSQFLNFGIQSSNAINNQDRMGFETGSNMSAQTLGAMNRIQDRQMNAITSTSKEMVGTAGYQYAGAAGMAQAVQGVGQSLGQIGGAVGGMAAGMGGGNAANALAANNNVDTMTSSENLSASANLHL